MHPCGVLRVPAWIVADLDELGSSPPLADEERGKVGHAEARRIRLRRRLAEPDSLPKRLSVREERAALWVMLELLSPERG
jgi:hypothetical protein